MSHAYDRRIDVGSANEKRFLRITADFEDEDGEPIAAPYRTIAIEDEDTGEMLALTRSQTRELLDALNDALRVLAGER